jgi:zinc protease
MKLLQAIFNTIGILAVVALAWALGAGFVPTAKNEVTPQPQISAPAKTPQAKIQKTPQPRLSSNRPPAFAVQDNYTKTFNAEYFTLENGLEIVVIPNHRTPVVTHMVWYRVGAADEQRGVSGIAHFLEHLMFKGSGDLKAGEFSEIIRSLGGNDNAFTSQDYTAYFQSIPVQHLERVMRMEAGRMRGLNIDREEVDSERNVILEERRQRTGNNPSARLGEQIDAALFPNHPYGIPIIGWEHEMEQLSYEDAVSFYNQHYGPNNAILIVTGDVTGEEVYKLAREIYGALDPIEVPERVRTDIPPLEGTARIIFNDPLVRQPAIQKHIRVPSYTSDAKTALSLQILEEIMGGGPSSRLYKSLVIDQKIAVSAGMGYRSSALDSAELYVYASPTPGNELEELEAALDQELKTLVDEGLREGELQDSIKRLRAAAIFARDSLSGPAMIFGQALTTGSAIDDIEYWTHNIASITEEDVMEAAKNYLDPRKAKGNPPVIGYLLPEDKESK